VVINGLIAALAAIVAPCAGAEAERPPAPLQIRVVVRTADGLVTGRGLRYDAGEFRLFRGRAEVRVAAADVVRISFLPPIRDELDDPVVIVARVMARPPRGVKAKRSQFGLRLREGVFLLPQEPVRETFLRFVPAMEDPVLAALLCTEVIHRCMLDREARALPELFEEAEAAVSDQPDQAFVYALMRAAVFFERELENEVEATLRHIGQTYPQEKPRLLRFIKLCREPGERAPPPRPGGPKP